MTPDDVAVVDTLGKRVAGEHAPSSELPLHLDVISRFPDIPSLAVVHTHSPYATAFAVVGRRIPLICNEGLGLGAAAVQVSDFAPPGTAELGKAVLRVLDDEPETRAILIANHGTLTLAPTLQGAYDLALQLEWSARIYYLALQLGQPRELSERQMVEIVERYRKYSERPD
jgi:L-fuculose-phosphate aldolase